MRRNSGVNTFISVRNSNDPIRARAFILRVVRYFIWAIIYLTALKNRGAQHDEVCVKYGHAIKIPKMSASSEVISLQTHDDLRGEDVFIENDVYRIVKTGNPATGALTMPKCKISQITDARY